MTGEGVLICVSKFDMALSPEIFNGSPNSCLNFHPAILSWDSASHYLIFWVPLAPDKLVNIGGPVRLAEKTR